MIPAIDLVHHPKDPFLDRSIIQLYQSAANWNEADDIEDVNILIDLCLDLDRLDCAMGTASINKEVGAQLVLTQMKLIKAIDDRYRACNQEPNILWEKIEGNLNWLGEEWKQFIKQVFFLEGHNEEELNLFRIIVLSSCLEQCLGNLLLAGNYNVPPLLKDLLQELAKLSVLDSRLVHLLLLILGPPYCLNIRNLIWHGFFEPQLMDTKYWHFLLCLTVTIGQNMTQTMSRSIPTRKLYNFDEYEARIAQECPDWNDDNILEQIRSSSIDNPIISTRLKSFWQMFFDLSTSSCKIISGLSYCLLLPLFEASLRYLFCYHNNITFDYLAAMMGEYYVTFEEIFEYELDGERFLKIADGRRLNRLYLVLPKELMITGLDIFLLPEGVRFRDRIGHGQVDFGSINEKVGNFVLLHVLQVLKHSNNEKMLQLPPRSLFHGTTNYQLAIEHCLRGIVKIEAILPNEFIEPVLIPFETELDQFRTTERDLMNRSIYRNNTCDELIASGRSILVNIRQTLLNIEHFLVARFEAAERRQLRERQRNNLQTLLAQCPTMLATLARLVLFFAQTWINLEAEVARYEADVKRKRQKARSMLKAMQNMANKTQLDQNKWAEACEHATTGLATLIDKN